MNKNNLTLTIIANMSANYGEGIGNISQIQKFYRNGRAYAKRSKESLKHAIMEQSSLYDGVHVVKDGKVAQKGCDADHTIVNTTSLEAGYMVTIKELGGRKKSSCFCITDATSFNPYVVAAEFHNNLGLAMRSGNSDDMTEAGLMPYNYEYSKDLKGYSFTIRLDEVGVDNNFKVEISAEEKANRVIALLSAIEHLSLVVKGSLDDASPLFVAGGFTQYRGHMLENLVTMNSDKVVVTNGLLDAISEYEFKAAVVDGYFGNDAELKDKLAATSVRTFFKDLKEQVKEYYLSAEN